MEKRQIVNIVNFIRGVEPRNSRDLIKPLVEQIALLKKHGLKGTFLVQYDALIDSRFTDILKQLESNQFELGIWYEIVEPQVQSVGLKWRGRFPWDWHTDCGFSVGYTKSEREALVSECYDQFKKVFGYYPKVFGSWFLDTHTVRFIKEKYGLDGICICKDQYGTDGYTLWGGYYGQGYYPSQNNLYIPASSKESGINVPVFRMLGADPVYQYDFELDKDRTEIEGQSVITLEPACYVYGGGSDEKWVDWFLKENFNGDCLSFGYAQAGQENSFGWDGVEKGIGYQYTLFEKLQNEGKLTVETLGESGRWYKSNYDITPSSAIVARTAFDDVNKNSVWYSSRFYRINLYSDNGSFRIRDLHMYSDEYKDPFEDTVCKQNQATYDTLPVVEGNLSSGNGLIAGAYIVNENGSVLNTDIFTFTDEDNGTARVDYGEFILTLYESSVSVKAKTDFRIENKIGLYLAHLPKVISVDRNTLLLSHNGTEYRLVLEKGFFIDANTIHSDNCEIKIVLRSDQPPAQI